MWYVEGEPSDWLGFMNVTEVLSRPPEPAWKRTNVQQRLYRVTETLGRAEVATLARDRAPAIWGAHKRLSELTYQYHVVQYHVAVAWRAQECSAAHLSNDRLTNVLSWPGQILT